MSVLSRLRNIIPPPQFMTLPSAGVDISDTSVKYVRFGDQHRSDGQLKLEAWGDVDIADGALKRGDVIDPKGLTDSLRKVGAACGTPYVRVSLPEERAYLFETEIKRGTAYSEIRGLLEFRMEENVPLSPRDAFFDYDVIESKDKKAPLQVIVTAYSRKTILSYYDACHEAGLVPLSFEVEAQAIARAATPLSGPGAYLIVDFGKTRTGIGVVHGGELMYTSTIDVGGSALSAAMRATLGEDTKESELTNLKNTKGLIMQYDDNRVYQSLQPEIDTLIGEMKRRTDYWHSKNHADASRRISNIILCGGSVNMAGLPSYITQKTSIHAERADIWQHAFSFTQSIPPITKRYSYGYATAVGLALTDFVSFDHG